MSQVTRVVVACPICHHKQGATADATRVVCEVCHHPYAPAAAPKQRLMTRPGRKS